MDDKDQIVGGSSVYVVYDASIYGDERSVEAVYTSKELAEEHRDQLGGGAYVETFMLNPRLPNRSGTRRYRVVMSENGVSEVYKKMGYWWGDTPEIGSFLKNTGRMEFFIETTMGEGGAISIANTRREKLINDGEWPVKED